MIIVDSNKLAIEDWILNRDIRYSCPVLYLCFQSPEKYDFSDKESCVVFRDNSWTPLTYTESFIGGGYLYSLRCYPTIAFKELNKFYRSSLEISTEFRLQMLGSSGPVQFDVPTTGLNLVKAFTHYRRDSLLMHWNNLSEAIFLYFESDCMISSTFGGLLRNTAQSLDLTEDVALSSTFAYSDSRRDHEHLIEDVPGYQTYSRKLDTLFGRKFALESPNIYIPSVVYTDVTSQDWHPEQKKLICLSCVGSRKQAPNTWHTIFAEVEV